MNKTLEALLRGYVVFKVNGNRFWTYNAARAERVRLCDETRGEVVFYGWSVWRRWQCFYYRPFAQGVAA